MNMNHTEAHKVLVEHAVGTTLHANAGMCPDFIEGPHVRDPDCKVCQALMVFDAATTAPAEAQ